MKSTGCLCRHSVKIDWCFKSWSIPLLKKKKMEALYVFEVVMAIALSCLKVAWRPWIMAELTFQKLHQTFTFRFSQELLSKVTYCEWTGNRVQSEVTWWTWPPSRLNTRPACQHSVAGCACKQDILSKWRTKNSVGH